MPTRRAGEGSSADGLSDAAREEAADAAIAQYLERVERGEFVDRERFLAEHPDAADELRDFFDADSDFSSLLDSVLPEETVSDMPAGVATPRLGLASDRPGPENFRIGQGLQIMPALSDTRVVVIPSQPRSVWKWLSAGAGVLLLATGGILAMTFGRKAPVEAPRAKRPFAQEDVVWDGKQPLVKVRLTPPRANKLVGHWDFTRPPGEKLADQSGGGNAGALVGGPLWLSATEGMRFDGQNDAIDLGNPAAWDLPGAITMVAWLKIESGAGLRNILAHGHCFQPAAGVFLRISSGQFQAGSWGPGGDHLASVPIAPGDLGNWVHLTGVYDGKAWRLYVNGALAAERVDPIGSMPVNDNWAIGATGDLRDRFFHGQLREVRIYDRALTPEEVAALPR